MTRLRRRRDFLANQFADDFLGGGMFGCGLDTEPVSGKVVHRYHTDRVTGFGRVYFRRVPRNLFFQRPCFRFSHSWHYFLLLRFQQIIKDTPALHRVKHNAGVFIKLIIHQFKHISGAVETNPDVFVFISFNWAVILVVLKSMVYVLSADTMPKRRVIELNNDFHTYQYTAPATSGQGSWDRASALCMLTLYAVKNYDFSSEK
jgi:hypothetical protein